jgi:antirestriction protein ArdC
MTDGIIAAIEKGTAPWQKPWDANAVPSMAYNPTTGKEYHGGNVLWLMCKGYSDPRWMTYKQAQEHDWQIKKGEHGTCIVYWKRTEMKKENDPTTGKQVNTEVELKHPVPFYATVFNASQIEGVPALERREVTWDPVDRAEAIIEGSGAKIVNNGGNRAFYRPATDDIHLPARAAFPDASAYYDTALHELGHWTGHPDRLNRANEAAIFGSPEYAKEELRAEIASFFTSTEIGLPHNTENHASYVSSWIKALQDDKHEIFRAARDAEAISTYLLEHEAVREQAQEEDRDMRPVMERNEPKAQPVYVEDILAREQAAVASWGMDRGDDR